MKLTKTELQGVVIIEPAVYTDARGFFFESYRADRYAAAGLPQCFVQDNHSCSVERTIRGLHYQLAHPQGKLVRVIRGTVLDVAVDIRIGSPTFARWVAVTLSQENKRQLYIPAGFAHGFCVTGGSCELEYKCTDYYVADDQHGIRWNDPTIAIAWPVDDPILSQSDRQYGLLTADRQDLPAFEGADS